MNVTENAAENTNPNIASGIDSDKLIIVKGTDTEPAWTVGDVINLKQFYDARVTLKYAIQTIQDQLAQDDERPADWKAKARKALRLKRLALEVLEDRFDSNDDSDELE